ncbi:hypothetical protein [Butyrivibrio sp. INlla14]|uniref:hypothetical protein n=1 Tax=Butyrivibrio sp. INlla14 TaxID=1520808 RepID=UPI0008760380|nr:hypothetical protein [Butyrivibrio sp. INlla14]SCX96318.1 hypothetical protein SAMN02910371_00545 [Butyrivibrio sp. INlla14]
MPLNIDIKNTSHGDDDFRETLLVDLGKEKIVIKISSNGFTDEKHLVLWERIAKEYRNLGYYCPKFIRALDGTFPTVVYKDMKWLEMAKTLPEKFTAQIERIWNNWLVSRRELEKIYHRLPTSVFQADINDTNVLLDEEGNFRGVYDFNIGGKEVYNLKISHKRYIG